MVLLALLLFASQGLALRREQRERETLRLRASELEVQALKQRLHQLVVHQKGRREVIDLDDVAAIRGADDYAELMLADGRTRLLSESLAALTARLPGDFLRVHRSTIVNLRCVREIVRRSGGGQEVVLTTGLTLPVGRTFSQHVRGALKALAGGEP